MPGGTDIPVPNPLRRDFGRADALVTGWGSATGTVTCFVPERSSQRREWFGLVRPVKQLQEGRCLRQGHRADPVYRHSRCP